VFQKELHNGIPNVTVCVVSVTETFTLKGVQTIHASSWLRREISREVDVVSVDPHVTMAYNTQNLVHRPEIQDTMFRKLDPFPSSGERKKERREGEEKKVRANIDHRNRVAVSFPSPEDGNWSIFPKRCVF
jgi:hypothetical protein